MDTADTDSHDGREGRGQSRAGHSHFQWEHQNIVHDDIEDTAGKSGCHGKGRISVVPDEGIADVVHHEKGSEKHKNSCIRYTNGHNVLRASQKPYDGAREKEAGERKDQAEDHGKNDGVGKIVIRFLISSGAINFKTGGGTYADHRSDSEDQAVERQNQVQGGDTVRTLGQGDEKSICQHIGR